MTLKLLTKEPKPAMILRLLNEALIGKPTGSLPDALEFRRDQYEITQKQFAAILGLQNSHYCEVINGKRRLLIGAVKRAYAIGIPADILLQQD